MSAILLAKILDENVQEIPSTMTELYSKYMELVLGRWDMSKSLQSQMEYDVILNVSIQVARMMIDNSLDRIAASEVRSMCENYIKGRNLKVDCNSVSKKMLGKRELYFVSPFDETVTFNHRTFAEYLYALGLERVGKFEIGDKVYDPYWTATYFFVFGLRRDAPELIEELDKVRLPNEIGRLFKINNHAGFLLAAYLTPYAVIQSSLKIAIGQAAALLREAYSNANSPLAEFSEIQLLCIITCTLCNAYGYDYFKPALYEISVDLYSSPDLKDRMLEIFFVNSALAASSDGKAFDTLISSYGPEIPLPLQVGIMAQAEGCVGNSGILDKYIRNFHKKLKGNPGLRLGLTELVETPISKKKAKMVSGAIQA
ncbi:hypothetical protein B0E52_04595 [Rhodanobacter sp. C06]|nr:hypothetical protein B0E52_04595 [Rhodanobacter sp. C06]